MFAFYHLFTLVSTRPKSNIDKKAKKAIINAVTVSLSNSDEIKNIFGDNYGKIIENVKNLLGRIHRLSLKETILYAIEYTPYTRKVFDYERNEKISDDQTQLELFVQKAVKHRDFMSHLFSADDYFKGDENNLAKRKLELLFRLCVLHDIGLEITENSLDDYIGTINREFYKDKKAR